MSCQSHANLQVNTTTNGRAASVAPKWTEGAGDADREFTKWDFVIERSDGTRCWLHPSYGSQSFHYGEEDLSLPGIEPPKAGRGSSDFKGHYKVLKHMKVDKTLKFAKARAKPKAQPKAAPTAA